ncbi:hypothetical protein ABZ901_27285 [Actinacidiphila alni]|uniref:hypothetical protein n=1 Tax=Actinacidiphila alni TaxID=380248 RepID=UPI00340F4A6F
MSRETDSSSSGPQGRGGAAYPSGTPPYGSRPFPSLHPQERTRPGEAAAPEEPAAPEPPAADEPKTETTLTTRIRINIPGSRPIPPVVVRTPVDESAPSPEAPAAEPAPAAPEPPAAQAAAEPEPEKTSDWFAPRKPPAAGGGSAAPAPAPSSPPPPAPAPGPGPGAGGTGQSPYLPPPVGTPLDGARGPHDTPAAGFASPFVTDPQTEPPFGIDAFPPGVPRPSGDYPGPGPEGPDDPFPGYQPPAGPTTGPVTGSMQVPPAADQRASAFRPEDTSGGFPAPAPGREDTGAFRPPNGPNGLGPEDTSGGFRQPMAPPPGQGLGPEDTSGGFPAPGQPGREDTGGFRQPMAPPPGQGLGPEDTSGGFPAPGQPGPGLGREDTGGFRVPMGQNGLGSEDTSGGFRGPAAPGPGLSGDTLVSGIPAVQGPGPAARSPRAPEPKGPGAPMGPGGPAAPAPVRPEPAEPRAAQPARPAAKKKGRSKVALAGVAVGTVVVLAYGAGLLMDHGDVPKGTTVLGVDIGNQSKGNAVKMLDDALGNRTTAPLNLTIGDRKQTLKPSVAGLSVDTDATVRGVAHSDYNPVSVIGSLFGGSRDADPVIVVDEDKLKVALKSLAGKTGSGSDGMVRFDNGKAVAVPGKPGQSFDVDAAAAKVAAAYRTRAETGADPAIALPVTTAPPKVTQAELDAAVNGFGKHAMSGLVTVRGGGRFISFGPTKSIPKFLTMVPDGNGKLQPHIDLDVLKGLYGHTFDNALIKRKDGTKTAATPQDVANALIPALDATGAKRDVTLPTSS